MGEAGRRQNGEARAVIQDVRSYIFRVIDDTVYVYVSVDGRRDMQALLARRLLGA